MYIVTEEEDLHVDSASAPGALAASIHHGNEAPLLRRKLTGQAGNACLSLGCTALRLLTASPTFNAFSSFRKVEKRLLGRETASFKCFLKQRWTFSPQQAFGPNPERFNVAQSPACRRRTSGQIWTSSPQTPSSPGQSIPLSAAGHRRSSLLRNSNPTAAKALGSGVQNSLSQSIAPASLASLCVR